MSANNFDQMIADVRDKFNSGDIDGYIETLYTPDATFHFFPPGLPQGHEGARMFYGGFMAAFPNAQFTPDDIIEEGDRIAMRYHLDVTHEGDFQGIPATGKRARLDGISILRLENGKVAERWNESDFLSLLQQLGVLPAPVQATS